MEFQQVGSQLHRRMMKLQVRVKGDQGREIDKKVCEQAPERSWNNCRRETQNSPPDLFGVKHPLCSQKLEYWEVLTPAG